MSLTFTGGFRTLLEVFPEVRELVHDFYHSKYATCLQYLAKLKPGESG